MPLGKPDACKGDCAKDVAQYILATFKGAVQCSGPHLAARGLRLLTVREYKSTLADLVGVSAQPPAPCGLHTFTFAQGSKTPSKVHVAGSFNGWPSTIAAGGWAMAQANGTWSVQKQLAPGSYTYKLVLDESQWIADPGNPNGVPDGFGGQNSSLDVTCDGGGSTVDVGTNLPPTRGPRASCSTTTGPAASSRRCTPTSTCRSALLAAKAADSTKLVTCDGKADPAGCAHTFVTTFGQRAFRRPLTPAESARLEKLVTSGTDFDKGVRTAMRRDAGVARVPLSRGGRREASPTERIASRRGRRRASSRTRSGERCPTPMLFDVGREGRARHARGPREAGAPPPREPARARDQIGIFAEQWLGAENVSTVDKSATLYPDFDAPMRAAMREETRRVVDARLLRHDACSTDLFTANWTVANDALAKQYGLAGRDGLGHPRGEVPGRACAPASSATAASSSPRASRTRPRPSAAGSSCGAACSVRSCRRRRPTRARVPQGRSERDDARSLRAAHGQPGVLELPPVHRRRGLRLRALRHRRATVRDQEAGKPIDSAGDMNDVEGLGTNTHAPFGEPRRARADPRVERRRQELPRARSTGASRAARASPIRARIAPIKARLLEKGGDLHEMMLAVVLSSDFMVRR